jgi:hypothetical protein
MRRFGTVSSVAVSIVGFLICGEMFLAGEVEIEQREGDSQDYDFGSDETRLIVGY